MNSGKNGGFPYLFPKNKHGKELLLKWILPEFFLNSGNSGLGNHFLPVFWVIFDSGKCMKIGYCWPGVAVVQSCTPALRFTLSSGFYQGLSTRILFLSLGAANVHRTLKELRRAGDTSLFS